MINQEMLALGNKRSIIREIFEYSKIRMKEIGADNVYDFSLGNPSVEPPVEIKNALRELNEECNSTLLHGYTSAQGDAQTRCVIADDINTRFNLCLSENNIYITCGAAASLAVSLKAICNPGDEVVVFAPYFTEYRVFIANANAKIVEVNPVPKTFQIDLSDFEGKITNKTKAVIINSPNNPSGVVYDESTVKGVADVLDKKSRANGNPIYLIADEPYRELVFDGVKVPYWMNYYKNTLVCYSYSKALSLPGERIGYIAVHPEAENGRDVYSAICGAGRSMGYVCAPSMFQQVIKKCINAKVDTNIYKENRDILYANLTEFGYDCVKPDGAFYLFVKSPSHDAFELYERAKSHEVLVVPCDDFGVNGYVRIAYCVDKQRIVNSLPAFKQIMEEYKRR